MQLYVYVCMYPNLPLISHTVDITQLGNKNLYKNLTKVKATLYI